LAEFRKAYQEAVKELPEISVDVRKIQEGEYHRRRMKRRRRYLITRGCAAAAVFCLCCAGTAVARNYKNGVIEMRESGYVITRQQEAGELAKNRYSQRDNSEIGAFLKMGGVFPIEEDIPEEEGVYWSEDITAECLSYEPRIYDSLEAFQETENIVAVIPDKMLFGVDFAEENVQVADEGRQLMIRLSSEEAAFTLRQSDNREYESYSSSTSYPGQCANKRSFTNRQGLSYVMFDSVDETGEVISIHAVISVNGWDLSVDFEQFGEDVVMKVLDSLDLSVYF